MSYNKEASSKKFQQGKYLLDRAYYKEAIEIFTDLINATEPLKDSDPDAKLTWDVSLNNRGVARCNLGYSSGDKAIFEAGLEDYRTTVNSEPNEDIRRSLTAQKNLLHGEEQIKDFDTRKKVNFKFEEL